jgi:diguanylate cyclase (GGDEF)-like protein
VQAAVEALFSGSSADVTLEFGLMERAGDTRARHELLLRAWPVLDEHGRVVRRAGVLQDVTERKRQDERIHRMAHYDGLTGLPNRFLLGDRLRQALVHAQRQHSQVAVLFMDLDRFKAINDTRGHLAGDQLLQQVAQRLRGRLREDDTIARVGGDEFVIVLPDVAGATDAAHVADKLMESLQAPFDIEGQQLHMSGSLGVSLYPRDATDGDSLLRYADTALYQAKDAGRNGYRFFSPDMDRQAHERLRLENELRVAIDQRALDVHFQPQVRALDGRIVGVEALARWHRPGGGAVSPVEFIHIAEETGLIHALGDQVLERACHQAARWHRAGHTGLRMAVNLSVRQLTQAAHRCGLVQTVGRVLADSGLPPDRLVLEITESGVFEDPEAARQTLEALRALGVQIAVDDFGTGYSNLAHLKRLPLSRLKIDRSLIAGLPHDADAAAIVQAVTAMARQLRLTVLCEGVETAEQRDFLGGLGVDEFQGWLYAPALPAEACERLLAQGDLSRVAGSGTATASDTLTA